MNWRPNTAKQFWPWLYKYKNCHLHMNFTRTQNEIVQQHMMNVSIKTWTCESLLAFLQMGE